MRGGKVMQALVGPHIPSLGVNLRIRIPFRKRDMAAQLQGLVRVVLVYERAILPATGNSNEDQTKIHRRD